MTTQEPISTDGALIVADKATVALAYESDESIQALIRKIETDLRAALDVARRVALARRVGLRRCGWANGLASRGLGKHLFQFHQARLQPWP